jgi:hypothetical protein
MLKNDVAHGLTVSSPNRDKLTMRFKPLKRLDLILSLSKDEDTFSGFFSILLKSFDKMISKHCHKIELFLL